MATAAQLRLRPADNGRALTLDEFREADEEEGHRYELAGGVLEVTEVPNDPHGGVVCNLYRALASFYEETIPFNELRGILSEIASAQRVAIVKASPSVH